MTLVLVLSIKERFPIGKLYVTKRCVRITDVMSGDIPQSDRSKWLEEGVLLMLLDITPIIYAMAEKAHCFKFLDGKKIVYANFLDDQPPFFIERLYESV